MVYITCYNKRCRVQGGAPPWNDFGGVVSSFQWLSSVGETAAPPGFLRENAKGAGMPPLLSHGNDQARRRPGETGERPPEDCTIYLSTIF